MKKDNYLFKSESLGFRNWKNGDLDKFIKLNSDDKVMEHFPKSLSKNETGKLFDKLKNHFTVYGFSQDIDSCRAVVVQTVKAINAESEIVIEPHLAADFEMAGHKGEIAKLVGNQLIFQLGDTIESYEEVSQKFEENKLVLTYSFTYAEGG
jgi:hypothetical protein